MFSNAQVRAGRRDATRPTPARAAQAILNTNRVLLKDLRARVGEWCGRAPTARRRRSTASARRGRHARSRLGDVFLRLSDFFKIYIEYANNYDAAHDELDKLLAERCVSSAVRPAATPTLMPRRR